MTANAPAITRNRHAHADATWTAGGTPVSAGPRRRAGSASIPGVVSSATSVSATGLSVCSGSLRRSGSAAPGCASRPFCTPSPSSLGVTCATLATYRIALERARGDVRGEAGGRLGGEVGEQAGAGQHVVGVDTGLRRPRNQPAVPHRAGGGRAQHPLGDLRRVVPEHAT